MATSMITKTTVLVALLSAFLAAPAIYNADLVRTFKVMGVFRNPTNTAIPDSSSLVVIDDTTHCEDLHYHAPSNLLFTACEGNQETRFSWFPPLANFDDPSITLKSRGSIHVIDPNVRHKCRYLVRTRHLHPHADQESSEAGDAGLRGRLCNAWDRCHL